MDGSSQPGLACRPGAGGGARRAAGHDGRGHADPGFGGDKAARGTEDPGPPTFATCPGLESEEENQLLLQDWTTGELKKRKRQTRPREVARPRALKGVDPGRRWDSPSPLLGGAWPGRCSLRCLRRLRRPSSDSGSHAPHFIPVPGEQRWVYVFI